MRKLTPEEQAALAAVAAMVTDEINIDDLSLARDWPLTPRKTLYRPLKQSITLRIDADILAWFKSRYIKGYQTRMNAALRAYIEQEEEKNKQSAE
jgi:uncharacterized protein (DUF4415 family)